MAAGRITIPDLPKVRRTLVRQACVASALLLYPAFKWNEPIIKNTDHAWHIMRSWVPAIAAAVLLAGCLSGPTSRNQDLAPDPEGIERPETVDARLFASVADVGFPEGLATNATVAWVAVNPRDSPSQLMEFSLASGARLRTLEIVGQDAQSPFLVGLSIAPHGRLAVLDEAPPRLLLFDISRPQPTQIVAATFPDLPQCIPTQTGPCEAGLDDQPALPDVIAYGPDGTAYVTDFLQSVIWRIEAGSDEPVPWLWGEALAAVIPGYGSGGPNGIDVSPDGKRLAFTMTSSTSPSVPRVGGRVYEIEISESPTERDLRSVRDYEEFVEDVAYGASGRLYVVLLMHSAVPPELWPLHQGISVIEPDGSEVMRLPTPQQAGTLPVPVDGPASLDFDGAGGMLLTNHVCCDFDPVGHAAILQFPVEDVAPSREYVVDGPSSGDA